MKNLFFALSLLTATLGCVPANSQVTQQQLDAFDKAATGTNTYAVTINAVTAAAPYDGQKIWLRFAAANTGASTLAITIAGGTVYTTRAITLNGSALVANDIVANQYVGLVYYLAGLSWQLQRAGSQAATQTVTITAGTGISVAGSVNTFTITNTSPATDAWLLAGNALTGSEHSPTEFFGSTNNFDVVFRENNTELMRLYNGLVGVGTATPTAKLQAVTTTTSTPYAIYGTTDVDGGYGVYGENTSAGLGGFSIQYGVRGSSSGTADNNIGVYGIATNGAINNTGVYGIVNTNHGASLVHNIAVRALNSAISTSNSNTQIGLEASKSGNLGSGTARLGYGVYSTSTGTANENIAGYFSASGATLNYGIIVPSGGGNSGFGTSAPTAKIHLGAGTTAASTAPLKFTIGTNTTTAEVGALEFSTVSSVNDLYFTHTGTTRHKIARVLTGSGTLDFANLAAIGCEDLTLTVTGAADGDEVAIGVPNASIVANSSYSAWVSAANTVTVRFCALISGDPASGTFQATVIKN